ELTAGGSGPPTPGPGPSPLPQPRRLRVGFLSAFFFHHSVGLLTKGVILGLPREKFEVTAIFIQPNAAIGAGVNSMAEAGAGAGAGLPACRASIAALELDVLVFTEIGDGDR
ncbi:unnamed protein product, partial [Discosporangium mesarthrocarpum]